MATQLPTAPCPEDGPVPLRAKGPPAMSQELAAVAPLAPAQTISVPPPADKTVALTPPPGEDNQVHQVRDADETTETDHPWRLGARQVDSTALSGFVIYPKPELTTDQIAEVEKFLHEVVDPKPFSSFYEDDNVHLIWWALDATTAEMTRVSQHPLVSQVDHDMPVADNLALPALLPLVTADWRVFACPEKRAIQ